MSHHARLAESLAQLEHEPPELSTRVANFIDALREPLRPPTMGRLVVAHAA